MVYSVSHLVNEPEKRLHDVWKAISLINTLTYLHQIDVFLQSNKTLIRCKTFTLSEWTTRWSVTFDLIETSLYIHHQEIFI